MKKMMVLAVLGLFLFGCDSDEEEGGCTTNADCAEGEMCEMAAAAAAEEGDDASLTDAAEGEAAAQAAAAGGDLAGAAAGGLLGGDDSAAAGTCVEMPEVVEPVVVEDITASQELDAAGDEADHVGKACKTVEGFCHDEAAEAENFCSDNGGVVTSGECDGKAASVCCEALPCTAKMSDDATEYAEGVCVGTKETRSGEAFACAGTLNTDNNDCPNNGDLVGCCVPAAAEEAEEEATEEGGEATE